MANAIWSRLEDNVRADLICAAENRRRRDAVAVSVIIPHVDDLENLRRCLSLLAMQTMPKDEFEIIVVDNNSRCGIEAVRKVCGGMANAVPAPIGEIDH